MNDWVTRAVLITHDVGLHARPAVTLTKLARGFVSVVEISRAGTEQWIDAKSIVKVMGLKAKQNTTLHIRARGPDALKAVQALADLVEQDFEKEEAHATSHNA